MQNIDSIILYFGFNSSKFDYQDKTAHICNTKTLT